MKLDHCHRASCTQIIEALRAENARLILLEGQHEFNHSRYLNLCRDLAAMTKERDELRNVFLTDSVASLASQFAAKDAVIERLREALDWSIHHLEKHHDCKHVNGTFPDMRLWLEQALAIPNDSSALEARLAQEREKIRAEMINEAWSKTGEERSMK